MKKIALILSIIVLTVMTTTITAARGQKEVTTHKVKKVEVFTGKVVSADAASGKIIIMHNGWEDTLQAQPKMLEGVMAGKYYKIERTGDAVTSIKVEQVDIDLPEEE